MLKNCCTFTISNHWVMKRIFFLFLLCFLAISCKTKKTTLSSGNINNDLKTKEIISLHRNSLPNFETLSGILDVFFDNGKKQQNFPLSLRMKKNETIWLSAPLGIAKALITSEKIQFYNKLDNTYFEGDFHFAKQILGAEINFEMLQNLLLGQLIISPNSLQIEVKENNYTGVFSEGGMQVEFALNPKFRIEKTQITENKENIFLSAEYQYQEVEEQIMPAILKLISKSENQQTTIEIEYKNLQFNQKHNFPYKVPSGYKLLTIE